jgi:hypothetical protein
MPTSVRLVGMPGRAPQSLEDRLLARVEQEPEGCWIWTGALSHNGYGTLQIGSRSDGTRRMVRAHRLAYELFVGPIPEGHEIDHHCSVRRCCNPSHLEAVTQSVNNERSESPSGKNAKKTHCKRGHRLANENLYVTRSGERHCRTCKREAWRRYYHRKKEE